MRATRILLPLAALVGSSFLAFPSQADVPTCNGLPATIVDTPGDYDYQGTSGDDVVVLTGTYTQFTGNGGNDTVCITGSSGQPYFTDHRVVLGNGDDWVQTGAGNDEIDVAGGNDTVKSGAGDDRITDSGGVDNLNAGAGTDFLDYRSRTAGLTIDLGAGTATDTNGTSTIAGFEGITGSAGNDVIHGTNAPERFENSGGHDEVYGRGGDDTFTEPAVTECLQGLGGMISHGGKGDDTFLLTAGDTGYGDRGDDTGSFAYGSVFYGGPGADLATHSWTYDEQDWDENDTCPDVRLGPLGGKAYGGSGRDTLAFDWYYTDNEFGRIAVNLAKQTIQSRGRPSDGTAHVEGFAVVSGGPSNDLITGGDGPNSLYGRKGKDRILGGKGNDHINGGAGIDRGFGGRGRDTCKHVEYRNSCTAS